MPLVSKDYRWTAVFASKAMLLANILLEGCVRSVLVDKAATGFSRTNSGLTLSLYCNET